MDTKGLQLEFISWCKSKKKSPKTEEETKLLFHAFMKEKHPEEYKQAMENLKKQLATKAAHGAKLQYFRTLKNQCPEGEELYYYKKGGSVGCGCKKKEDGGEVKKDCGGGAVSKFKKMRQGGQPKVVNGSTKQPTIQGTAKMQEERKANENMTWDPKLKKMRKMTSEEIARTKKNQADARRGEGEGEPQHKCGGKVKKHLYGNPIYLTQFDYLNGVNLLKRGANKIWDLINYNITNNPNIITGAPDFLPGTGGGNIGKVVGQIRKIAPGVSKAKTTLKNGKVVNSLDKKVRMAKEADLRKEAGLSYWKNFAGRLEK